MIDPQDEQGLVGRGECFSHYHAFNPNHDDYVYLQVTGASTGVSATGSLDPKFDFFAVDTSSGNVTVTLPAAPRSNLRELEITKVSAGGVLYIVPTTGDTVIGSTIGLSVTVQWTSLRLKAIDGNWIAI